MRGSCRNWKASKRHEMRWYDKINAEKLFISYPGWSAGVSLDTYQSCTVHPVVCCYKNSENQLLISSLCFLSEELLRDVVMVHLIHEKTIQHLKKAVSQLEFMEYFSDGCATQYNNRKSFHNLCERKKEFGIKASWSFLQQVTGNLHVMALVALWKDPLLWKASGSHWRIRYWISMTWWHVVQKRLPT